MVRVGERCPGRTQWLQPQVPLNSPRRQDAHVHKRCQRVEKCRTQPQTRFTVSDRKRQWEVTGPFHLGGGNARTLTRTRVDQIQRDGKKELAPGQGRSQSRRWVVEHGKSGPVFCSGTVRRSCAGEGGQGGILKEHPQRAHPNTSAPWLPSSQTPSSSPSGTWGWVRGPEREAGGQMVAQVLPAHPGVGGNGQAGACPVLGDEVLMIGCLGTALDEHHVHLGSWTKRERRARVRS